MKKLKQKGKVRVNETNNFLSELYFWQFTSIKRWSESWPLSTPRPSKRPPFPFHLLPPLPVPLTHHLSMKPSYPYSVLDSHPHGFSRATGDSWNVIPACCPGDSCSQWKISRWYSAWLAASAEEGKNLQGIWWHVAFSRHLLPLLPEGGSCASSEHNISWPRVKRSDCTFRCCAVKSCLKKPHRRPQHKQDIHSWRTAATRKPERNKSESC